MSRLWLVIPVPEIYLFPHDSNMTFGLACRDLGMMVSFAHATEIRASFIVGERRGVVVCRVFYCRLIRFSGIFVQKYSHRRRFLWDEVIKHKFLERMKRFSSNFEVNGCSDSDMMRVKRLRFALSISECRESLGISCR